MSIIDQGCGCKMCTDITLEELKSARGRWIEGKREIMFETYHYECGDGCCSEYGTHVYVNGFRIVSTNGEDAECVIEHLMEFLKIDNVIIDHVYGDDLEVD